MRILIGILVASVTSLAASVQAAEGLVEVLAKAKQSDPSFLGAGFLRTAEKEAVKQARARLLPSLSFDVEQRQNTDTIKQSENQVTNATSADYDQTAYTLTLNQSIYNHEFWTRYRQSKDVGLRADSDFDSAQQKLLADVAERYFTVLKTQEQLGAIRAEKKALKKHAEFTAKSRKAGLGRASEVVDAEARYYTALAEEAQFTKTLGDAQFALMEMTGEMPGDLRPIKEKIPLATPDPASPGDWIEQGLERNPEVRSQQHRLAEARKEIKAQNAGHYPSLDLVYRKYNEDTGGSLFGGASETESDELALQFKLPIYQGGAVSSRKREAISRMYKTQEDLYKAKRTVQTEVNSAFQGVVANIAQIEALHKTVMAQKAVLENKQRGYKNGLYTILIVLDAQRDLANAERNYIAARYDYAINSLKLKRAAGVLVEEDLVLINNWLQ